MSRSPPTHQITSMCLPLRTFEILKVVVLFIPNLWIFSSGWLTKIAWSDCTPLYRALSVRNIPMAKKIYKIYMIPSTNHFIKNLPFLWLRESQA